MKLHPQEVSHYTVDLVEENAVGVVGMELDFGLVNKTTKEHVPAECSQAPTVERGAHISDWDLRLGTRWCKVLEGSIPLEGHGRGSGIEDEGGAWPTGAKGVRKIQSGCQ